MKVQISRFSGHQTSKILALMFALMTVPFMLVGVMGVLFAPNTEQDGPIFPFILFIILPLIYGVMGYIFNRFFCFIYNFSAKRVGGIEFETEEKSD
ncbi:MULTISPECIES: hypothetical protein [Pseudoalteromonas]|uniref:Uncharacterized protein n=1 Tax=Pseudoalteromonas obscura TaxID=3048491 RepID=A0ABT7EFB2_9GAMM|nr:MULTISPECIES: hypothetical protein [Pseudoalteromonas]MBQ4835784.1 hypothetical protein [Pseudoalteromonas luteoviolacea]MDK2593969.1 hypothetical protein [Pseudoalteromonas sp. P94(2023)]